MLTIIYKFFLLSLCIFSMNAPSFAEENNAKAIDQSLFQLSNQIKKYPSDVKFFNNNAIETLIKKIIPAHERSLINDFSLENPIEIWKINMTSAAGIHYFDYAFLINNCKPHDCQDNNFAIYLAKNNQGHYILLAYFHETDNQGTQDKWFTPVATCNVTIPNSKNADTWKMELQTRLDCLQSANSHS